MKQYPEKCSKNLLEKSIEKNNYEIALREWYFLNEVIDNNEHYHTDARGVLSGQNTRPSCELCEHEDLRWQFVIYNTHNKNSLKVGSSCIKQFDVALIDNNGNKIYGKERNTRINKLITLRRIESSNKVTFKAMDDLCVINKEIEHNKLFMESWTQLKVNGTIEPKLALFLINNFIENNIDISNLDIKIDIKKKKSIEQLKRLSKTTYLLLRPYLSTANQHKFDESFD